ncbi:MULTISPECIES: acetyl-CoA C-acyltransferase [unclassified Burkholderia]|uniref:thiolase family protein n=1 Tax=unclassified Burkholderia TaxID=2613784 RepID=UPI00158CB606|nr:MULTISPECIES: acetyl-CoA C-acyltransferase [unclassified Burkholderia]
MSNVDVVLCSPVRTAIGTYGGTLKDVAAPTLGAAVIRESLKRAGFPPAKIQSLVMGNVIQAGVKMNPARQAGIAGGLPVEVPALTVNRVCESGAQAIASAANEIWAGMIDCAVAGGMENMDCAPYLLPQGRWGARMGDVTLFDSMLLDGLNDAFSGQHSGWHTEDLVMKCGISREDQDRWALRSQQRFAKAQAAGLFDAEIAPLEIPGRKGATVFDRDEHNRPDTSAESLAKLKPAFRKDGTITAGNAPGLNSGAAAMLVAGRAWAESNGLTPMARLVSYGVGAVEPSLFGLGPIPAVRQAIARAGWSVADVDCVEINEAFAAIALACSRELGFAEVTVAGAAVGCVLM